jgi:hypothetical protein
MDIWKPAEPTTTEGVCHQCYNWHTNIYLSEEERTDKYLIADKGEEVIQSVNGVLHKYHIGTPNYKYGDGSRWVSCVKCGMVYDSERNGNGMRMEYKGHQHQWLCKVCLQKLANQ